MEHLHSFLLLISSPCYQLAIIGTLLNGVRTEVTVATLPSLFGACSFTRLHLKSEHLSELLPNELKSFLICYLFKRSTESMHGCMLFTTKMYEICIGIVVLLTPYSPHPHTKIKKNKFKLFTMIKSNLFISGGLRARDK